jgi:predicted nucleotidyltransferase component of viral defense system
MYQILKDIYQNRKLSPILGFKGGTACNLFYNLPRFSVDLDFDLLQKNKIQFVFEEVKKILKKRGEIKDEKIKKNTIFFNLSYGKLDQNIKIEISIREFQNNYELKNFYGFSIPVLVKSDMFANKLVDITSRKEIANRDLFDIYFFFENNWPINDKIIKARTGKDIKKYLVYLSKYINKNVNNRYILQGLGELLNKKQKILVKKNLKKELLSILKFYVESLKL